MDVAIEQGDESIVEIVKQRIAIQESKEGDKNVKLRDIFKIETTID